MIIVGLTGYQRCGKGSAAKVLVERFGFVEYGFADALRAMALAINPMISVEDAPAALAENWSLCNGTVTALRYAELLELVGYNDAKDIPDFRRFLQRLGTEGVRGTFGPTAWVDATARKLLIDNPARVVISDVRFTSEAEWVHAQGGMVWRMVRPGHGGHDAHASEAEIPSLRVQREVIASSLEELDARVCAAWGEDVAAFSAVPIPPPA